MTDRALCTVCGGNGVVKIPGGISTCDHCKGDCYEPDPLPAALAGLIQQWRERAHRIRQANHRKRAAADAIEDCVADLLNWETGRRPPPPLFQVGEFVLHAGDRATWKIDCDALTDAEIEALATIVRERVPCFGSVEGVPRGGLRLAAALIRYAHANAPLLIVDDVLTTGASMEQQRAGREAIGVVIFARGQCPAWVTPIFQSGRYPPPPETISAEKVKLIEVSVLMGRLAKLAGHENPDGISWEEAATTIERALTGRRSPPPEDVKADPTLKIAVAELAGYQDGFEGLPSNPTFSTSDENWAYQLWFGKARKVRSDLIDQIDTLARLLKEARSGRRPPPPETEIVAVLEELIINANRLCDRNLGGTYEEDCRRSLDRARKAAGRPSPPPETQKRLDDAAAQLLIELAFLVPRGTDMGPGSPIGSKLIAFRDAAIELGRPSPPEGEPNV